jgi:hypothetical protein
LQHAFEMLLKGAIFQKRGTIFEKDSSISHTFQKCLGIARSDLGILNENQTTNLAVLGGLRDCATHHLIDLSEESLYLHAQTATTLFDDVLLAAFGERLADHLPERVLPISTRPPQDLMVFFDNEFKQVASMISPGRRRTAEAKERLRHFMIFESSIAGELKQPTDSEVELLISKLKRGVGWSDLFPGICTLRLETTQSTGTRVQYRFTRDRNAAPVRSVKYGEEGFEDATFVREVDLKDRFTMSPARLAKNAGLTQPKARALIIHLDIETDPDCYHEQGNRVLNRDDL